MAFGVEMPARAMQAGESPNIVVLFPEEHSAPARVVSVRLQAFGTPE